MHDRKKNRFQRAAAVTAVVLLLGLAGGGPWPSSAPTTFEVQPDLLARLQTLAEGLHNEIVLCLGGHVRGDTAFVRDFRMPKPRESTPMRSSFDPCPPGTLASWHNHPGIAPSSSGAALASGYDHGRARRLCVLSSTDIETASRLRYPFVVVAVNAGTWCWWTLEEVDRFAAESIAPGLPDPARLAGSEPAAEWSSPPSDAPTEVAGTR